MDLAEASNQPIPVALAGREYPARCLSAREWGEMQAWFKRACPSNTETTARAIVAAESRGEPWPPELRRLALDVAADKDRHWPPRVGTAAWLAEVDAAEGGPAEFVYCVLSRTVPGLTRDDAARIADGAAGVELAALASVAFRGKLPDPFRSAPAPAATAAGEPSPPPSGTTGAESSPRS